MFLSGCRSVTVRTDASGLTRCSIHRPAETQTCHTMAAHRHQAELCAWRTACVRGTFRKTGEDGPQQCSLLLAVFLLTNFGCTAIVHSLGVDKLAGTEQNCPCYVLEAAGPCCLSGSGNEDDEGRIDRLTTCILHQVLNWGAKHCSDCWGKEWSSSAFHHCLLRL